MNFRILAYLCELFTYLCGMFTTSALGQRHKLMLILIDGFRWDYIELQKPEDVPGLNRLKSGGARAEWVQPIFPSISCPGWTSIATGLYAENHNIIGNYMYDVENDKRFDIFNTTSSSDFYWFQYHEPIWITATKNHVKTALFLWSRCDIAFNGILPEYCQSFTSGLNLTVFRENIHSAIDKLNSGFDLVMIYTEYIDDRGHYFGPESPEVSSAIRELDTVIVELLDTLEQQQLDQQVNIILVSDHGMAYSGIGTEYVYLDEYVDMDHIHLIIDYGAFSSIVPKPGSTEIVYQELQSVPGITTYKRDEIPEKYHFKLGKHVQELTVVAKPGYFVYGTNNSVQFPNDPVDFIWNGNHGYDPEYGDMGAIFLAYGPDFKNNFVGSSIEIVDIYQLFPYILQFPPQNHNGTWDKISPYLKYPPKL